MARDTAATLALGIAAAVLDALFVPAAALTTALRGRDRREIRRWRDVRAEHDQQRGREHDLTHWRVSPDCCVTQELSRPRSPRRARFISRGFITIHVGPRDARAVMRG